MGRELIFQINATADESAAEEGSTAWECFCRKKKKKNLFQDSTKRQKAALYLAGSDDQG